MRGQKRAVLRGCEDGRENIGKKAEKRRRGRREDGREGEVGGVGRRGGRRGMTGKWRVGGRREGGTGKCL